MVCRVDHVIHDPPHGHPPPSGGIDQDELGVLERTHLYHRLLADGGTVTGVECHAVDLDRALGRHEIAVAFFAERIFGGLARL